MNQKESQPQNPDHALQEGSAFFGQGRYEEALLSYDRAIALAPDHAPAHFSRGTILHYLNRGTEALQSYDRAIGLKPDYADAYSNRGALFQQAKQYADALMSYDKAVAINPDLVAVHNNRGIILLELKRLTEALMSCDKAIAIKADYAEAHNNRGNVLTAGKRPDDAITSYNKAIAINPNYAEAYFNRGMALNERRRYAEGLADLEKALSLNPNIPYALGHLLHTKMHLCDWRDLDAWFETVKSLIESGKPVAQPFVILPTPLPIQHQLLCAQHYVAQKFPAFAPLWAGEKYTHDKIRIGYFSSDLNAAHPLTSLMAEFFELHDKSRFETTAFSLGAPASDAMRQRLENAFDLFIDVYAQSDADIATLARNMEIDIAVDLNGLTSDLRTGIFAMRPAPVQVNYMGYPATMGASYIDYIVADATVIPKEHRTHYSEKIATLPDTYWVIDSTRKPSEKQFTRADMGLPEKGFVFCSFNNSFKITPDMFDVWMRLLQKVEGSVLWLLGNVACEANLRKEAKMRGVAEERIIFAARMDRRDHLARQSLADLFLDSFYYNAHTTASDALGQGLPLITCTGKTFASRVATSILHAAGLAELVTHSIVQYETLALELAISPQKLSAIRQKLADNRATCPLFDTSRFTRYFEEAYIKMHARQQAGLPPDHISL